MEGIVASLVDAITYVKYGLAYLNSWLRLHLIIYRKNGKKHPSNAPAAISIIHIISEGNPYILRQINSIGGDTKLREFQSTKIGGSRFVRILHERARVKAKEIDNRILNCISGWKISIDVYLQSVQLCTCHMNRLEYCKILSRLRSNTELWFLLVITDSKIRRRYTFRIQLSILLVVKKSPSKELQEIQMSHTKLRGKWPISVK